MLLNLLVLLWKQRKGQLALSQLGRIILVVVVVLLLLFILFRHVRADGGGLASGFFDSLDAIKNPSGE